MLNYIILLLLSISFVTVDWMVNIFTFSEVLLGIIFLLLLFNRKIHLSILQLKVLLSVLLLLTINAGLQIYFMPNINIRLIIASIIKISFYLSNLFLISNYINIEKLKPTFTVFIKIITLLVIMIGFYILFNLNYYHLDYPFEFFWTFTRNDGFRYLGERTYFRANSIFSEPAHYGFFLNIVLAFILYRKDTKKSDLLFSIVVLVGVITTFSYSAIIVASIILILYAISILRNKALNMNKNYFLVVIVITAGIGLVFWDTISLTLIQRTMNIIDGTDSSALNRIFGSWQYITKDNILLGNGLGHTPVIFNVYAYLISDLGVLGFIFSVSITYLLFIQNWMIGIVFILLNSVKGGYLSSQFWLMLFLFFLFFTDKSVDMKLLIKEKFRNVW